MNLKVFKLSLFILIFSFSVAQAQDSMPPSEITDQNNVFDGNNEASTTKATRTSTSERNNISAHLGMFDPWIGVYYERLIAPFWGFDVAFGLIGGSIGTKLYFPRVSDGKMSFYTGVSEGVLLLVGAKHYIPVGFTYLGKKGFRVSLDAGPQIYHDTNEEIQFGLSLKLGKSF